jgi:hypothetical protein
MGLLTKKNVVANAGHLPSLGKSGEYFARTRLLANDHSPALSEGKS